MSHFEEETYFAGDEDHEEHLNRLLENQDESFFYQDEDEEEHDNSDDDVLFVVTERKIQEMAEQIINSFYWQFDEMKPSKYVYNFNLRNDVLFIESTKLILEDKISWLDIENRQLFDYFDISIEIDSYYSSAEIRGIILDR